MIKIELPYDRGKVELEVANATVLRSRVDELVSGLPGAEIVAQAMAHPIASPRLAELAMGKSKAVVIISDHTRPVPSRDILPLILAELREGNPDIAVTLLVATGFHRGSNEQELRDKLGDDIYERERIVVHDSRDAAQHIQIGVLPSGAPLVINRLAAETELLVAEGFIEPHFFAGFSGGRKSVLPGICDQATVFGNHCSAFIDSPLARTGNLAGNPLHLDMEAAARMAGLAYIVNVILDERQQTVAAFAGDPIAAHTAGCAHLEKFCRVAPVPADIVITSNGGYPLDQNIYQCVKGLTAAEASAKPGAILISCAACRDGHGGESFYRALRDCVNPAELYRRIMATSQAETIADQWESQILARILSKHRVILVCCPEMEQTVKEMKMDYAASLAEAVRLARRLLGERAEITVIPNGIAVIVDIKESADLALQ